MTQDLLKDRSASVEVARFETASGPRLRVRDPESGDQIFLDPIELEGLTRLRESRDGPLRELLGDAEEAAEPGSSELEVLQNEFAMVQIGRLETGDGPRLFIRDLASRAQTILQPSELRGLTRLRHRNLAPLLDPSELVAAMEPDPDQV
ncbi:MAG: hypothetical protein ACRDKZ_15610 [Actinomycetota bacterium]